jgi:hypothetical protein
MITRIEARARSVPGLCPKERPSTARQIRQFGAMRVDVSAIWDGNRSAVIWSDSHVLPGRLLFLRRGYVAAADGGVLWLVSSRSGGRVFGVLCSLEAEVVISIARERPALAAGARVRRRPGRTRSRSWLAGDRLLPAGEGIRAGQHRWDAGQHRPRSGRRWNSDSLVQSWFSALRSRLPLRCRGVRRRA